MSGVNRQEISAIAHTDHPIANPLSLGSVDQLLDRALRPDDRRVLDLGCGNASWLIRALSTRPLLVADGVDTDTATLARTRRSLDAGLADRLTLHDGDARDFRAAQGYDLVLSVGSVHAFGGREATLDALAKHLAPGGRVLFGDGFWEREPNKATLDLGFVAADHDTLADTVDAVVAAGWTPIYGHVSTQQEWDDYEWSWSGSLARWALEHPDHPDGAEALATAQAHRTGWLRGYRGVLGLVTLLLQRTDQAA
ncbi:MAG TPA: class I SAM-dependent methyltransferase [Pseudonocardiaceae bacterium]|jgi:SAM-dependent methyltransferase|nr:class I SAM-dependent methyltransferase [Pseudonocardiaceae bacterium]